MVRKHHLLLDEGDLLQLRVDLAVLVGDRHAIAIQQIHYWTGINEKAKKVSHFFENEWWTFNTWQEWKKNNFRFWSVSTIRRIFADLEARNLLITKPHKERNRGIWARVNYDELDRLTGGSAQIEQGGLLKLNRPFVQTEQTLNYTETTETKTELAPIVATSPRPAKLFNPYKDTLIAAYGWNWTSATKTEKGQIQAAAAQLYDISFPLVDIPPFIKYCRERYDNITPPGCCGHVAEWRELNATKRLVDRTANGHGTDNLVSQWDTDNEPIQQGIDYT